MNKKPRILLVQPTTIHLDGTPHKTRWRLIMGLSSYYTRRPLATQLADFQELTQVRTPKALIKRVQEWDAEIKAVSTATKKAK